jgi:hypothetical protein
VDQGHDEPLIVLGGKVRPARQRLDGNGPRNPQVGEDLVAIQYLVGLEVPVRSEDVLQHPDGWAGHAQNQLFARSISCGRRKMPRWRRGASRSA